MGTRSSQLGWFCGFKISEINVLADGERNSQYILTLMHMNTLLV